MNRDSELYTINVGPLASLPSLTYFLARPLAHLSELYSRGKNIEPIFDLTGIEPRRQNMATLAAFLAIAERLRNYVGHPVKTRIEWIPKVLGFWDDINFLSIVRDCRILDLPTELVGGYVTGKTNPNTLLFRYCEDPVDPVPPITNATAWDAWKGRKRSEIGADIDFLCKGIFNPERAYVRIDDRVRIQIAMTAAELIVNSLMHGRAPAYVGLQRSPMKISVAVCDCGDGFPRSLHRNPRLSHLLHQRSPTDIQGLLAGSLVNVNEMGLRRAIEDITAFSAPDHGYIIMSSFSAEIRWEKALWQKVCLREFGGIEEILNSAPAEILGASITGTTTTKSKEDGYYRIWEPGLRGTRITFEVELADKWNKG